MYVSHADLLTDEGIESFKAKLNEEGLNLASKNGYSSEDLNSFSRSINNPNNLVFYGWVEQTGALLELLSGKKEPQFYLDRARHLEHQLANKYKQFLSPFLAESLLKFSGEKDISTLNNALSFCQLLDEDHSAVVESELFKTIKKRLLAMKSSMKSIEEEQGLIDLVKPLCSDEIITSVNSLSKASYALKLEYVDSMLAPIRVKSCTTRFANWILKQMEGIELNKEHEHKIVDLKRELREGELEVRNHGKGRTPIRWKNVIFSTFILGIAAVVFVVIYFKPFSEVKDQQFTNSSSFKQFTKEERIKIDSLLQAMNGNKREEEIYYDQGVPLIGQSTTLTLRKEFKNPTMEGLYNDLIKDAENQKAGYRDSCKTAIEYKRNTGIKNLIDLKGDIEAVIKNESDYDIIVYVAENRATGEVFSLYVPQGSTEVFTVNKYNTITVIAGNKHQAYVAHSGLSSDDKPSSKFKTHFCETDDNYKESINTSYKVIDKSQDKVKFMVMGSPGSYFHLIDLNGVLEAI